MDVLGENYVLKGMVRCTSHHFTVAVKDDTHWVYIDDMCVSVKRYTSFQDLLHNHLNGWFFAIFEKSSITVNDEIQGNSQICKTLQQDSNNLFVGTLPTDHTPSIDNTNFGTVTKSSATCIAFYANCFSVLKPCSYWKSDTDAIVECGSAFFIETIKNKASSSELPQILNICGANINIKFVSRSRGTLVCGSPPSILVLEDLILQNVGKNTGFLLHFSKLCFGCVFHKTSRSTTFFFFSFNGSQGLEIHTAIDTKFLVNSLSKCNK